MFVANEKENICPLIFADDIASGSGTEIRLQRKNNLIKIFYKFVGMTLIFFRNGGYVKQTEKMVLHWEK